MNKSKIFYGKANTGKTREARRIMGEISENKCVFISSLGIQEIGNFFFSQCTKETELIILDDLPSYINPLDYFIHMGRKDSTKHIIKVNKHMQEPFEIEAHIIITTNHIPNDIGGARFDGRFDVIHFYNAQVKIN